MPHRIGARGTAARRIRGRLRRGARIAILASRDGTEADAVAKVFTSSLPRADQRPCSTQNDAIGRRPDFGGSTRLTLSTRSCWPPFTMSPAWMNTSSVPRFSICSSLTVPVSCTLTAPFAQRLVEGERHGARGGLAVDQIDRKVLVNDRAADAILVGARRDCGQGSSAPATKPPAQAMFCDAWNISRG